MMRRDSVGFLRIAIELADIADMAGNDVHGEILVRRRCWENRRTSPRMASPV